MEAVCDRGCSEYPFMCPGPYGRLHIKDSSETPGPFAGRLMAQGRPPAMVAMTEDAPQYLVKWPGCTGHRPKKK